MLVAQRVHIGKRPGFAELVIEPVIGVHDATVPVIDCVAVIVIRAGFRDIVHLSAGEPAVLAGITVTDHCCVADCIGSEHQVGSAGVTDIGKGVVIDGAIQRERVRSGW